METLNESIDGITPELLFAHYNHYLSIFGGAIELKDRNYKEDEQLCDEICLKIIQYINTPKEQKECHTLSNTKQAHNISKNNIMPMG